ncbi:MAG: DUF1232 domain-containing protein [Candidatus Cloacimonetes bacterium]|jgi:uncharacterized membrane protein YkvA (DUF1232 family)|nr:DUF1232 domain-containing protein [Candidatus Cloacimonadota bacterium]MCB5286609.1 DUF1232 domain-containing protein [Candidatus Cloacimonadota bacterium]MCK9184353.1 YkvA family protein [Candidatus Cloacimonadota bacterium]MCK9583551.1 YkvA family protein [Candidatus Cloacimonadota bacterium]MDY0228930.1 YkvA family protein [Candidatus Cloacimonadaceae bacterium]
MKDEVLETREIPVEEQDSINERIIDVDHAKLQFYEKLRKKAKGWTREKTGKVGGKVAEYLFLLPDFFILVCRLAVDKRVPAKQKLMVTGIIAYFIMPFDIIPDFIPVIGYVDDLVLAVLGLNLILNEVDAKILRDNWSGEGDVLGQLQKVTAAADNFLDRNLMQRIRHWLQKI